MAKLKCDQHKLRIFAVNGKFIHRSGWDFVCNSPTASIGGVTYTAKEIEETGIAKPKKHKDA